MRLLKPEKMTREKIDIRPMVEEHWPEVADIYKQGIDTGIATFEDEVPTWESWNRSHLDVCRFTAFSGTSICGWAALSPVSSRCVYGGVAEVSVYVSSDCQGKGVGKALMTRLITESERQGYWTLQSGIFPENAASIRLHEAVGFRKIGYRERIGKKNGVWTDNILMERRSAVVGIEN